MLKHDNAAQLRAARALLGIDQRKLAELSGLSLPTIQRMEAERRGDPRQCRFIDELVAALDGAASSSFPIMPASSSGGRGVRLKMPPP